MFKINIGSTLVILANLYLKSIRYLSNVVNVLIVDIIYSVTPHNFASYYNTVSRDRYAGDSDIRFS